MNPSFVDPASQVRRGVADKPRRPVLRNVAFAVGIAALSMAAIAPPAAAADAAARGDDVTRASQAWIGYRMSERTDLAPGTFIAWLIYRSGERGDRSLPLAVRS